MILLRLCTMAFIFLDAMNVMSLVSRVHRAQTTPTRPLDHLSLSGDEVCGRLDCER
jgi:hypothetical protein